MKILFNLSVGFYEREEASVKPPSSVPAALSAPPFDASSFERNPQVPFPIDSLQHAAIWAFSGGPPSYNPSLRDVAGRHRFSAFGSFPFCDPRSGADTVASIPAFSLGPRVGHPLPPPPPPFLAFKIFQPPFWLFWGSCLRSVPWRISRLLLSIPTRPIGMIRSFFVRILQEFLRLLPILLGNWLSWLRRATTQNTLWKAFPYTHSLLIGRKKSSEIWKRPYFKKWA